MVKEAIQDIYSHAFNTAKAFHMVVTQDLAQWPEKIQELGTMATENQRIRHYGHQKKMSQQPDPNKTAEYRPKKAQRFFDYIASEKHSKSNEVGNYHFLAMSDIELPLEPIVPLVDLVHAGIEGRQSFGEVLVLGEYHPGDIVVGEWHAQLMGGVGDGRAAHQLFVKDLFDVLCEAGSLVVEVLDVEDEDVGVDEREAEGRHGDGDGDGNGDDDGVDTVNYWVKRDSQ